MSDVEQIRECASGLCALALKARDNNLNDYAARDLKNLQQMQPPTLIG
jgi:hypothetical protein